MEGHFHVSFTPVPALKNNMATMPSGSIKTSKYTGKPIGFWYAIGLDWLPVLDRNYANGIQNAIKMSLGVKNTVNATSNNNMKAIYPSKLYVYSLNITDDMKTTQLDNSFPNKILQITDGNIGHVISEYNTYKNREIMIKSIQNYIYTILYKDENTINFLKAYFDTIEIPDEDWYNEYIEYYESESDEILDYINENMGIIEEWLNKSVEHMYNTKKDELLALESELPEFIEGNVWSTFWKDSISPRFAGVEFEASVVNLEGGPIWAKFLDIPSGCLFRPNALGVRLELQSQLSLDPTNNTRNMNVFSKTRNIGTVKRIRAVSGGRRKSKTRVTRRI